MSLVLMDDVTLPTFNAVADVDYGPGTSRTVRYGIAEFLDLIDRFVEYSDPLNLIYPTIAFSSDLTYGSLLTGGPFTQHFDFGFTNHRNNLRWNLDFDTGIIGPEGGTISEFPSCPFADGIGDPREDADSFWTLVSEVGGYLSIRNVAVEEAGWDVATAVWVPFSFSVNINEQVTYVCQPSLFEPALDEFVIPSNVLGIDYVSGGGLFPTFDDIFPLGDGTTGVYVLDPGGTYKFMLTSIIP